MFLFPIAVEELVPVVKWVAAVFTMLTVIYHCVTEPPKFDEIWWLVLNAVSWWVVYMTVIAALICFAATIHISLPITIVTICVVSLGRWVYNRYFKKEVTDGN